MNTQADSDGSCNRYDGFHMRPIDAGDSATVRDIIIETLLEYGATGGGFASSDSDTQDMFTAFQKEGRSYFVIETVGEVSRPGGVMAGLVLGGAGIAPLPGEKGVCELVKMYFRPGIRGLGLGKRLLKICMEEARRLGYHRIYLETLERMHEARGLYEHMGFTRIPGPMGQTGHYSCDAFYLMDL